MKVLGRDDSGVLKPPLILHTCLQVHDGTAFLWEGSLAVLGSSPVSAALSLCEDKDGAHHAKLKRVILCPGLLISVFSALRKQNP